MNDEMLPCPFCNNLVKGPQAGDCDCDCDCDCDSCDITMSDESKRSLISRWNTRKGVKHVVVKGTSSITMSDETKEIIHEIYGK